MFFNIQNCLLNTFRNLKKYFSVTNIYLLTLFIYQDILYCKYGVYSIYFCQLLKQTKQLVTSDKVGQCTKRSNRCLKILIYLSLKRAVCTQTKVGGGGGGGGSVHGNC